jgi:hypothetical protein
VRSLGGEPILPVLLRRGIFPHALVFDRSSLTRWRQRMGEDKLKALLQESLAVATRTDAMKPSDLARVVIDTTVQPKAVMFPTDAKLLNRARERLVHLAKKIGVSLRQSYARVGKLALIKHQRYAHAHQFKRANRSLRMDASIAAPKKNYPIVDPVRHRQFKKLMESLSWIAQRMDRTHPSEPLWFENVRTMLSHFNVFLREFDPVAAKKFRRRKKSRVDHRSMAQHSETLIKKFERTGNL